MSRFPGKLCLYDKRSSLDVLRLRLHARSLLLDVISIFCAFVAANTFVLGSLWGEPGKPHGLTMFAMIAPAYSLLALGSGLYGIRAVENWRLAAYRALSVLFQAALLAFVFVYLAKVSAQLSRATFSVGLVFSCGLLWGVRTLTAPWNRRLLQGVRNTVLINDDVRGLASKSTAVVDARQFGLNPERHDANAAARLAEAVIGAERVIVACSIQRMDAWSSVLKSLGAKGEIVLPELMQFAPAKMGEFENQPTIIVAGGALAFRDRAVKRLLDLCIAIVAIGLLSPVLISVAVLVKMTSRGPILFRQQRLGLNARPFQIYKFRTMKADECDPSASQLTRHNDRRVTSLGRLLRRTSLDELPQLFNVLKGEMSIVGPRPHAAGAKAAGDHYWVVDERYWARHCIKPGLTGLAQVRGYRGPTDEHRDLINRLQSDLEYVTGWSVWTDLKIIGATLGVLTHHNAV